MNRRRVLSFCRGQHSAKMRFAVCRLCGTQQIRCLPCVLFLPSFARGHTANLMLGHTAFSLFPVVYVLISDPFTVLHPSLYLFHRKQPILLAKYDFLCAPSMCTARSFSSLHVLTWPCIVKVYSTYNILNKLPPLRTSIGLCVYMRVYRRRV
jgi:hypothetical protein